MNYRRLWIKYHGEIPKDENGIPYDIHHIDGNRNNNNINNLIALSIKDHYLVHLNRGDWYSANLLAIRLNLSKVEKDHIKNKLKNSRPKLQCHHCGKIGGIGNMQRWHFDNCYKIKPKQKLTCPKCGKTGSPAPMKQWHFDNCGKPIPQETMKKYKKPKSEKHRLSMVKINTGRKYKKSECPHCNLIGAGPSMKKYHFNNCQVYTKKPNPKFGPRIKVSCPHCGFVGGGGNMKRYHFDKCKAKK